MVARSINNIPGFLLRIYMSGNHHQVKTTTNRMTNVYSIWHITERNPFKLEEKIKVIVTLGNARQFLTCSMTRAIQKITQKVLN